MPNIRSYDAPAGIGLQPSQTGVEAVAGAARRGGAFFNQAADSLRQTGAEFGSAIKTAGDVAVKYMEHDEISKGAAGFATLQNNLLTQWNETAKNADPNDPSTAGKFIDDIVNPSLEKFTGSFNTEGGQKYAEQHIDSLRQQMFKTTSADMSTLAGIAVQQNYSTTVNKLSSTVRSDPASLDFALKTAESSVGALASSSPNLDATAAAKVSGPLLQNAKEQIVKSWFMGVAEKNPDEAVKQLESGKYSDFIKGDEAKTIIGYARTNARLARSEQTNARVMADYTAKQDFHKAANDLELSTIPADATGRPTLPKDYWQKVREIGQMPGAMLEPSRLKQMVDNGERITARLDKPEPLGPVSHAATMDLLAKIRSTDASRLTSNDAIYQAYGDGKLNTGDFNFLQKEYANIRTPEGQALNRDRTTFFKQYAGAITGGLYDPIQGSPKMYAAEMDARRREADLQRKGLDPHLIYDPSSEYFIGKPANLRKYQSSMQEDLNAKAAAPAQPEKPAPLAPQTAAQRPEPPPSLRGIADLQWSPKRQMYRDGSTGKVYNANGEMVKP